MVSYQKFTSIAFDVAKQQGAQFDGVGDGGTFVSTVVSVLWRQHRDDLTGMTIQQARQFAQNHIEA